MNDGDDLVTKMMQGDSATAELGNREAAGRATTVEPNEGVPVRTPAPASALSPEERQVFGVLTRHRGRGNAVGLDVVALQAGISEREVQRAVASLIEIHGQPIGSAVQKPMGYFLIETDAELSESLSQLIHRITALARRIAALKRSTTPIVLKQLALEMEQAA